MCESFLWTGVALTRQNFRRTLMPHFALPRNALVRLPNRYDVLCAGVLIVYTLRHRLEVNDNTQ